MIVIALIGLLLYYHGFLLTRKELNRVSSCNINSNELINTTCLDKQYNRVFFFIIDALRSDFINIHPNSNHTSYNNFEYLHSLIQHNSSQCLLFNFHGDPPTTTTQRLKGYNLNQV